MKENKYQIRPFAVSNLKFKKSRNKCKMLYKLDIKEILL